MQCKMCGNDIEEPHTIRRKYCRDCQKKNQSNHEKKSRVRKENGFEPLTIQISKLKKQDKRLRNDLSKYKNKTKRLLKVIRALEKGLIDGTKLNH